MPPEPPPPPPPSVGGFGATVGRWTTVGRGGEPVLPPPGTPGCVGAGWVGCAGWPGVVGENDRGVVGDGLLLTVVLVFVG